MLGMLGNATSPPSTRSCFHAGTQSTYITFQMQERQTQKGSAEAQNERFLSCEGALVLGAPSTVGSLVSKVDRDHQSTEKLVDAVIREGQSSKLLRYRTNQKPPFLSVEGLI